MFEYIPSHNEVVLSHHCVDQSEDSDASEQARVYRHAVKHRRHFYESNTRNRTGSERSEHSPLLSQNLAHERRVGQGIMKPPHADVGSFAHGVSPYVEASIAVSVY